MAGTTGSMQPGACSSHNNILVFTHASYYFGFSVNVLARTEVQFKARHIYEMIVAMQVAHAAWQVKRLIWADLIALKLYDDMHHFVHSPALGAIACPTQGT